MLFCALGLLGWFILVYQSVVKESTLTTGRPFEFNRQDLSKDGFISTRLQVAEALLEVQPSGKLSPKLASSHLH